MQHACREDLTEKLRCFQAAARCFQVGRLSLITSRPINQCFLHLLSYQRCYVSHRAALRRTFIPPQAAEAEGGSAAGLRRADPPGRQGALQRLRAQAAAAPARPEEKAEAASGEERSGAARGAGGEWGSAAARAARRSRRTGTDEGGEPRAAAASRRGTPVARGRGARDRRDGVRGGVGLPDLGESALRCSGIVSGNRGADGGRLRGRGASG